MGNVTSLGHNSHSVASRIEAGAAKGIRYGYWKMGNTAFDEADFGTALDHYRKAAELGLGIAARAAGFMLSGGVGCVADQEAATSYYMAAADNGNGTAALQVGLAYLYGQGVGRDREIAIAYFQKATATGVKLAKTHLVLAKLKIMPLESAGQTSLKLLELSREKNDAAIHHAIGVAWLEGYPGWSDLDRAASAFRYAAGLGCDDSKLELARLLMGSGNASDVNEAIQLLLASAKGGIADAAAELGTIYISGSYGVPQDIDYGRSWLEKAALGNSLNAQVVLAKHLMASDSEKDLNVAKHLLIRGLKTYGCIEAAYTLAYYMDNSPLTFDACERHGLLELCAEAGATSSMIMLAKDATIQDAKLFWLQSAIDDASVFAQFAMGCELWNLNTRAATAQGLAYFKSASKFGSLEATKTLAEMYCGAGGRVKPNLADAAYYYVILADGSDEEAKEILADLKARGVSVADESATGATVLPITGGGIT